MTVDNISSIHKPSVVIITLLFINNNTSIKIFVSSVSPCTVVDMGQSFLHSDLPILPTQRCSEGISMVPTSGERLSKCVCIMHVCTCVCVICIINNTQHTDLFIFTVISLYLHKYLFVHCTAWSVSFWRWYSRSDHQILEHVNRPAITSC